MIIRSFAEIVADMRLLADYAHGDPDRREEAGLRLVRELPLGIRADLSIPISTGACRSRGYQRLVDRMVSRRDYLDRRHHGCGGGWCRTPAVD